MSIRQSSGAGGLPISRIETIADGTIDPARVGFASLAESECTNWLLKDGDILISHINSTKHLGKCAIYEGIPQMLVHGMNLLVLRCDQVTAAPRYVYRILSSSGFQRQLPRITKHSVNQSSFNISNFKRLHIPLPPLAEQKRIAGILDAADALRAKRREAIAQLDTLLQSTFLDMFGDPVTNPMGWEQSSLGKLCDVGSSKRVFVNDLVEEGVPFYRGTEVGLLGEGEAVSPSLFITHDHYEQLKRHSGVPRPGDLLLPSICHDGRIFIVRDNKPFYFKDGRVLWIKSGESDINSAFLRYHLKAVFFSEYSKIASGTTFAELKIFALKNLVVHVPPRDEQNRFTNFVESIERQKARMRAHLAELDALFASLQSRAFNGEL
nr:restriction endonuclease subunit S [Prosthecochloris ethylica]